VSSSFISVNSMFYLTHYIWRLCWQVLVKSITFSNRFLLCIFN
jgi:hypothetical protein